MKFSEVEEVIESLKKRPVVTAGLLLATIMLFASGAWLNSYFSERGKQAAVPPKPKPKVPESLKIEQVLLGSSEVFSVISITVKNNSASTPVELNNIAISLQNNLAASCETESIDTFILSDKVVLSPNSSLSGAYNHDLEMGVDYPVSGSIFTNGCNIFNLKLDFDVDLAVDPNSLKKFRVFIPKQFGTKRLESDQEASEASIAVPVDLTRYSNFSVVLTDENGSSRSTLRSPSSSSNGAQ